MAHDVKSMMVVFESDGNARYLFGEDSRPIVKNEIKFLNSILVKSVTSEIVPNIGIDTERINYVPHESNGPVCYSFLWENKLTPSGKLPKYPYTAYINEDYKDYIKDWGNLSRAKIFYLSDWTIGKTEVTMWRNKQPFVAKFKIINDSLNVWRIYTVQDYAKKILFEHK